MIRHLTDKSQHQRLTSQDFMATKVVLDKVLPRTFLHDLFSVIMICEGQLSIRINECDMLLSNGTLLIIPPGHRCEIFEAHGPLILYNCSYTSDYAKQNLLDTAQSRHFNQFIKNISVAVKPNPGEIAVMEQVYGIICNKPCSVNTVFTAETLKLYFNLFICELTGLYFQYHGEHEICKNNNDIIVQQFMALLRKHIKLQHSVQYYADALYMSAGHLTRIVKQAKNKTVKQLIEEALVTEAKKLLNHPEMSILQITEELDFTSLSVFSSFFKKHTTLSPSHYRQRGVHI